AAGRPSRGRADRLHLRSHRPARRRPRARRGGARARRPARSGAAARQAGLARGAARHLVPPLHRDLAQRVARDRAGPARHRRSPRVRHGPRPRGALGPAGPSARARHHGPRGAQLDGRARHRAARRRRDRCARPARAGRARRPGGAQHPGPRPAAVVARASRARGPRPRGAGARAGRGRGGELPGAAHHRHRPRPLPAQRRAVLRPLRARAGVLARLPSHRPTLGAYREEIELIKELGFNAARIHQKVEDPRFLFWADRLGLLIWGETANAYAFSPRAAAALTAEWTEIVEQVRPHPSVVTWVPMNESWGVRDLADHAPQKDLTIALTALTRSLDPSRPVVSNDGYELTGGDIIALHDYTTDADRLAAHYADEEATAETIAGRGPQR